MSTGISFSQKGDFNKLNNFLEKMKDFCDLSFLDKYGKIGVEALSNATPKDTGKTANSWKYETVRKGNTVSLEFHNTNIEDGNVNIAIILQYGHGTGTGGYVEGIDYINPAIQPVFEDILEKALKEVK